MSALLDKEALIVASSSACSPAMLACVSVALPSRSCPASPWLKTWTAVTFLRPAKTSAICSTPSRLASRIITSPDLSLRNARTSCTDASMKMISVLWVVTVAVLWGSSPCAGSSFGAVPVGAGEFESLTRSVLRCAAADDSAARLTTDTTSRTAGETNRLPCA